MVYGLLENNIFSDRRPSSIACMFKKIRSNLTNMNDVIKVQFGLRTIRKEKLCLAATTFIVRLTSLLTSNNIVISKEYKVSNNIPPTKGLLSSF